jgi:non-specific serine/threonine protein kinase/serine/threonine-protein kinase
MFPEGGSWPDSATPAGNPTLRAKADSMLDQQTSQRWAQLDRLMERALDVPANERKAFVERECAGDAALKAEALALVSQLETRNDLFDIGPQARAEIGPDRLFEPGQRVGAYRVLAVLGRGGMGEVYLAERADGQIEQTVALKVLRPDAVDQAARFLAERQILARLEHPGIARLYDAGITAESQPYMIMERVDGVQLTRACDERGAGLDARLELFLQVCEAVAYAHRNLIVHRDLKPGNIMVTAAGQVKLLDFGVAKYLAQADSHATRETPVTLSYAAPEQLQHARITTATDVYALGVLLFELLTGRTPWNTSHFPLAVAIQKLLNEEAPAPSGVESKIVSRALRSGDLDAIVAKALRKNPADRYQSVDELAQDVRRHMRGEPIGARDGAVMYVLGRFLKRYRWPVAGVASVLIALAAGLAGTAYQAREAARERDIARTEAARSDAVRDYLMLMFREAAEEKGEGELTAKQVLERSASQLMAGTARQSGERLEVFQALGELYAAIDDYEGAAPIFRHYLATVGPNANPALRAEIQHNLAVAEFRLGNAAEARKQLKLAQDFWNRDPDRYRESLASSRTIQSQLERDSGDTAQALRTLQAGLAERVALSGRSHRETAYILNALGLAQMNAGQLQDADRTLAEAVQIMTALGKQDTGNTLTMISNQAVIAAMLGDSARAEPLFVKAVQLRRQLYGRSAALAALQQNLGRLMVRSGRAAEAKTMLDDSLAMAREFTGPRSALTVTIMLSVAEANVLTADSGAETTLQDALKAIASLYDDKHVLYARGEQVLARLRIQQGRRADAKRAIDSSERKLVALGPPAAPYLAEIQRLRQQLTGAPTGT